MSFFRFRFISSSFRLAVFEDQRYGLGQALSRFVPGFALAVRPGNLGAAGDIPISFPLDNRRELTVHGVLPLPISTPARSTSSSSTSISTSASLRKLMLLLPALTLPSLPAYASVR